MDCLFALPPAFEELSWSINNCQLHANDSNLLSSLSWLIAFSIIINRTDFFFYWESDRDSKTDSGKQKDNAANVQLKYIIPILKVGFGSSNFGIQLDRMITIG